MTPAEERAALFIRQSPYYILGYIQSLEDEINRIKAAMGVAPMERFEHRRQFQEPQP